MKKTRILLVDDDPIFRFIHGKILKSSTIGPDLEVITVNNGQEALDHLNECIASMRNFPDFILLDLNMPVMDGVSFLKEFKKLYLPALKCIRIIILSTDENPFEEKEATRYHIWKYVKKPLSMALVSTLLRKGQSSKI